jgi:hypothetical protein
VSYGTLLALGNALNIDIYQQRSLLMFKRSALCLAILSALAPISSFAEATTPDALEVITVTGSKTDQLVLAK